MSAVRAAACAVGLFSSLCGLLACDKDVAFFIYQNQAPLAGCTVSADSDVAVPEGLLDVSLGRGYELFPLLRNELPARKATNNLSVDADANVLHLREFHVRLQLGEGARAADAALADFKTPTSGTLYPGDRRATRLRIIPDELLSQLAVAEGARPTIIARVVARADSGGGIVESVPFYFPVELCNGCLVRALDRCSAEAPLDNAANVCGLPQDAPLVCCKDPVLGLHCPAGGE